MRVCTPSSIQTNNRLSALLSSLNLDEELAAASEPDLRYALLFMCSIYILVWRAIPPSHGLLAPAAYGQHTPHDATGPSTHQHNHQHKCYRDMCAARGLDTRGDVEELRQRYREDVIYMHQVLYICIRV